MRAGVFVLVFAFTLPGFAKKIDPADFTVSATVTEIKSFKQTDSVVGVATKPTFCDDPKGSFQKGACSVETKSSGISTSTYFVVVAEIQGKVYELEGPRLELETYKAKFGQGPIPAWIQFLLTDKKGKPVGVWYKIVAEHKKSQ